MTKSTEVTDLKVGVDILDQHFSGCGLNPMERHILLQNKEHKTFMLFS